MSELIGGILAVVFWFSFFVLFTGVGGRILQKFSNWLDE